MPKQPDDARRGKSFIFPQKKTQSPLLGGSVFRAGVIGLHPIAGLLVGGGGGYFLWKRFDAPWCFWILLGVGFAAGCLNAYRDVRAMLEDDAREEEMRNARKTAPRA